MRTRLLRGQAKAGRVRAMQHLRSPRRNSSRRSYTGGVMATHRVAPMPETAVEAFFFDVETMDASEEAVDRDFAENYETPKNYKDPEAIERHRADARAKWTEKAALL